MKKSISTLTLLLAFFVCLAADLTGNWTGMLQTPDGNEFPITYRLKAEGSSLSGTVVIPDTELAISHGKVADNKFSFSVSYQGTDYPIEGELDGDQLKVKVKFGEQVVSHTLKREK